MGENGVIGLEPTPPNGPSSYREPYSSYAGRRYWDLIPSMAALAILAFMDIGFLMGGLRAKAGESILPLVVGTNTLLPLVMVVYALMSRTRRGFRRYESGESWVTLPFGRAEAPSRGTPFSSAPIVTSPRLPPGAWIEIPGRLPTTAVADVSLEPAKSLPNAPSLVKVRLRLQERDAPASVDHPTLVVMRADDFGVKNLRDFILRVPSDRIAPGFSARWRERAAGHNDPR